MAEFRRDNHFVPKIYLKRWSENGSKIWGYRTLVSHQKVPLWNNYPIRGIAFHSHLYTRVTADGETDEFECWLSKEFESPAEEAIYKATSGKKLTYEDWKKLIRFTAAQNVRTPVQLLKTIKKWNNEMPELMTCTLHKVVKKLERAKVAVIQLTSDNTPDQNEFPIRISRESSIDPEKVCLKVETAIGRNLWLFNIKHILTKTVNVLLKHKWCVFRAAPDFEWITSDDPVVCLNYYNNASYDFEGGWGNKVAWLLKVLALL